MFSGAGIIWVLITTLAVITTLFRINSHIDKGED